MVHWQLHNAFMYIPDSKSGTKTDNYFPGGRDEAEAKKINFPLDLTQTEKDRNQLAILLVVLHRILIQFKADRSFLLPFQLNQLHTNPFQLDSRSLSPSSPSLVLLQWELLMYPRRWRLTHSPADHPNPRNRPTLFGWSSPVESLRNVKSKNAKNANDIVESPFTRSIPFTRANTRDGRLMHRQHVSRLQSQCLFEEHTSGGQIVFTVYQI